MSVSENLLKLQMNGFCILGGIIPQDKVGTIRESVVDAQARYDAESAAKVAEIRARGHRIGYKGVGNLDQVINETQCFAPYLADGRILDLAEAIFGPFVRISSTACVINRPGNDRGYWHADWPYNQTNASHIRAPYPDTLIHLSTIWMLSEFTEANGGTFLLPGSHRMNNNPSAGGMPDFDPDSPYPTEIQAAGKAGSVLLYDSRLWHAVAPNCTDHPRVAMLIRYAPWWLNLNPAIIGRPEHTMMVVETEGKNYENPPVLREVYDRLPEDVKPLYRHCVE
jgi:ectoine hydroxylase-related dioxygenase (phytanoyl-CoA dioxygenase family)